MNPRSAGGSTGRRWPQIVERLRGLLPPFDTAFTDSPGHATQLAADAVGRYPIVAAVGGDGTVNEVVNGLVDESGVVRPGVALGIIPLGTGADFVRTVGIPHVLEEAASLLALDEKTDVDVGRARFRAFDGSEAVRYFINEAEVGMGAAVCETANRSSKRLGGRATFLWAILITLLRYRDRPVSFAIDGGPPEAAVLNNAWIANGRYSGGGILSAPRARPDDGLLDLVLISQAPFRERVRGLLALRSGAFVDQPHVDYRAARRVEAMAETDVPVEVDGEHVGTVPATFELAKGRLPVIS